MNTLRSRRMSVTKNWLRLSFALLWRAFLLFQIFGLVFGVLLGKFLLPSSFVILIKPTILYGSLALVVVIAEAGFKLNLLQCIFGKRLNLSKPQWRMCALSLALLLATMAVLSVAVAFSTPFDFWLYYKVFGSPVIFVAGIFAISWIAISKTSIHQ